MLINSEYVDCQLIPENPTMTIDLLFYLCNIIIIKHTQILGAKAPSVKTVEGLTNIYK